MIRRTLLVVDGTGAATAALTHAAAPARSFEGDAILLPVGTAAADEAAVLAATLRSRGLRSSVAPVAPPTGDRVLGEAVEWSAELIVLPSGDGTKQGIRRARLAQEVIARAPTSVLIAPPAEAADYRRIVVPVDGSRRAEWALCLAISLARTECAELVLVHAIAPGDDAARQHGEAYLSELAAMLTPGDPRLRTRILEGASVPAALTAAFSEERPDLIAITAHGGAPANGRRYGRIASALIARAPAAMLVFQDAPRPVKVPAASA